MKQALKLAVARRFGFTVVSLDFAAEHACFTWKAAMEWMACYPATDFVGVQYRGKIVATRGC